VNYRVQIYWFAAIRQIIETVNDKLHNTFRLSAERPFDLTGFQSRLAAKVALYVRWTKFMAYRVVALAARSREGVLTDRQAKTCPDSIRALGKQTLRVLSLRPVGISTQ
jgi:hypothetical protein